MQNEWKPIKELAHRSYGDVLAWDGELECSGVVNSNWLNEYGWKCGYTHWMPLPDPPRKPVTFTKEQKAEIKRWVEANKRFEEIGTVVCLDDSDGLISFIDALPE